MHGSGYPWGDPAEGDGKDYDSRRRGEQRVEDHMDGPTQKMMCRFQATFVIMQSKSFSCDSHHAEDDRSVAQCVQGAQVFTGVGQPADEGRDTLSTLESIRTACRFL